MKNTLLHRNFLLALPFIIASCYYDNEEALYPEAGNDCDTTSVSFELEIVPILSTYCYACHSNQNAPAFGSNIRLQDHADVSDIAETAVGAINHNPAYSPMPKGGSKLNDCLIDQFEAWVNQGSLNN